jgi:putative beta-lysine N-acetyltransferase
METKIMKTAGVMETPDQIVETANGSILQHGKLNDRVYLMQLSGKDTSHIVHELEQLAREHVYSKIFCIIPPDAHPLFLSEGYILEGYIPAFYRGKEDAFFVSRFPGNGERFQVPEIELAPFYRLLSDMAVGEKSPAMENPGYTVRQLNKQDAPSIARLYSEVFKSYPFPIHDPGYISKMMDGQVRYFGAFKGDELAALSSSEVDPEARNAEMTDFATSRHHAGNNLSMLLLNHMEHEMKRQGISTLYTIARLLSLPMNKTFLRSGFTYSGTLRNNTNISGRIESMNLYYKRLQ